MRNRCMCECTRTHQVSMESGLEDRNNDRGLGALELQESRLNGVRPRRPEQLAAAVERFGTMKPVSMESGLEDRNNVHEHVPGVDEFQTSQWSPA